MEIVLKDFASMCATNISTDDAGLKITITFSKDDITIGMLNSSISEIPMVSANLLAIEDLNECEAEVCFLGKQCSNKLGSFQCNCEIDDNDENGLCIESNSGCESISKKTLNLNIYNTHQVKCFFVFFFSQKRIDTMDHWVWFSIHHSLNLLSVGLLLQISTKVFIFLFNFLLL